ncbi:triose-phosphate transporter family-domain-containing protein [Polychytrium aggregatum]|uniref:triose-phosphate transporter family-domain-containing protein n=1 Tax=Polychytrium aggregatum TaxID=110093 RepID=UPI0022FDD6FC|nr:triose-phosphate transporter family-domain-containing protein [Polychytrium aggregatum]KAI9204379.1 triose-phosphate transporter family-domain-containing protein [Polychytrium aggregatum]
MPSPPVSNTVTEKLEQQKEFEQANSEHAVSISLLNETLKATPNPIGLSTADLVNVLYIALNIVSSVGIVMTNKWVFKGLKFEFGTLLTVVHFVVTFIGLEICAMFKVFERKRIPIAKMIPISACFCGFVVLTNLSLQHNTVGFYQISKVLTTPCVVLIQTIFYNMKFSTVIKLAVIVTCVGVVITSFTDVEVNFIGTVYAMTGVVVTSLYQILIGTKQRELEVNSMQLLYYQAPLSALMLLLAVPFLDDMHKLRAYSMSIEALSMILLSGFMAFFVNLSIFLVIGKTSAVAYNMVGHFKTCIILITGFTVFGQAVDLKNIFGILVTLSGVFWYSHISLKNRK